MKEQHVAQSLSISLTTARGKQKDGRNKERKEGRKERREEPDAGGVTKEEEKGGTGRGWGN